MSRAVRDSTIQGGRGRLRAFRPLVLWFCLATSLLAWNTYRKLAAGTAVTFQILVEGEKPARAPTVKLDGVVFKSGDRISVGKRTLTIDAPGLEPHERKLSVWFGAHDLGDISLTRSRGTIAVSAEPKPHGVKVSGTGFSGTATNTESTFGPMLVGNYTVTADFGFFTEERRIEVKRNDATHVNFKPAVGILALTSQPTNASYRLSAITNRRISIEGTTPARVEGLPCGEYQVTAWRGDYKKEARVSVGPGDTNLLQMEFAYAEVKFETTPAGANVFGDGGDLGETPLALREVLPGSKKFRIEKDGFMPLALVLDAMPGGVHSITTNLVSVRYGQAMQQAKRLAGSDSRAALSKLEEALQAVPNDSEALELKAKIESSLKAQETQLAERKQATELAAAARQQEAQHKAAEQRQLAEQAARKRFPAETFRKASESEADAQLFDAQRWSVQSDAGKVADALRRMLQREGAGWKLANENKVNDDTFQFRCNGVAKLLSTSRRHTIVVIGQTEPGAVEIHAKFWDYQSTKVGLSLTQGLTKDGLVPMHPRFFRAADKATVEAQRKSVPEDFKTKLFNELK